MSHHHAPPGLGEASFFAHDHGAQPPGWCT